MECFITKIKLNHTKFVSEIVISLDNKTRKHLILTGKNGSGKTTLLNELRECLEEIVKGTTSQESRLVELIQIYEQKIKEHREKIEKYQEIIASKLESLELEEEISQQTLLLEDIESYKNNILQSEQEIARNEQYLQGYQAEIEKIKKIRLSFSDYDAVRKLMDHRFLVVYFGAKRENNPTIPRSIEKVDLVPQFPIEACLYKKFIQYMVRLKNIQFYEKEKGEQGDSQAKEKAESIKEWFDRFERLLQRLFERKDLKLIYRNEIPSYVISYGDREFGFDELSDGYSALMMICAELILRMEREGIAQTYDMEGVVLIDEVETHLHITLQKEVMELLTTLFPKIQFIISTHSPFVLSSMKDTVVFDLEKRSLISQGLYGYSYDGLVESYFDVDKYSTILKDKIRRFEALVFKEDKTQEEKSELEELREYFEELPKFMADELDYKLNEIKLKELYRS